MAGPFLGMDPYLEFKGPGLIFIIDWCQRSVTSLAWPFQVPTWLGWMSGSKW